jgi:hypothetical protein
VKDGTARAHTRGIFERLARSGVAIDIALAVAVVSTGAAFLVRGSENALFWTVLGLLLLAGYSPSRHMERTRGAKRRFGERAPGGGNPRPLGLDGGAREDDSGSQRTLSGLALKG